MDRLEKQDYLLVLAMITMLGMATKLWNWYSIILIICVILIMAAWAIIVVK